MNNCLKTPLGNAIINMEKQQCARLVPSAYYARSLQIGMAWANYFEGITVSSQYVIDTEYSTQFAAVRRGRYQNASYQVVGRPMEQTKQTTKQAVEMGNQSHYVVSSASALPFPEKTHDLIILPHTLDFCSDPHEVLRQTSQILVAEGCIVIIGFNLISVYGIMKLFKKHTEKMLGDDHYDSHYYRPGRVQDWLALLGFDLVGAAMTAYQPPIQSEKWRDRLAFIEKAGDRWCPGLGGVYVIVGRKRQMLATAMSANTRTWRRLIPTIARPVSQQAARQRAVKSDLKRDTKSGFAHCLNRTKHKS